MFGPANLKNNTNVEVFDDKGTEFCKIVDGKGELTDLRCFQKQIASVPFKFLRVVDLNNVSLMKFRMTQEDMQKVVIDFSATSNSTFDIPESSFCNFDVVLDFGEMPVRVSITQN